jgi:hypothetical protein
MAHDPLVNARALDLNPVVIQAAIHNGLLVVLGDFAKVSLARRSCRIAQNRKGRWGRISHFTASRSLWTCASTLANVAGS